MRRDKDEGEKTSPRIWTQVEADTGSMGHFLKKCFCDPSRKSKVAAKVSNGIFQNGWFLYQEYPVPEAGKKVFFEKCFFVLPFSLPPNLLLIRFRRWYLNYRELKQESQGGKHLGKCALGKSHNPGLRGNLESRKTSGRRHVVKKIEPLETFLCLGKTIEKRGSGSHQRSPQ